MLALLLSTTETIEISAIVLRFTVGRKCSPGLWFVRKVVLKYHIVFTVDKLYESRDQLECIEVCLVTNRVA